MEGILNFEFTSKNTLINNSKKQIPSTEVVGVGSARKLQNVQIKTT